MLWEWISQFPPAFHPLVLASIVSLICMNYHYIDGSTMVIFKIFVNLLSLLDGIIHIYAYICIFLISPSIWGSLWTHSLLNLPYNPMSSFSFGCPNLACGSHFKLVPVLEHVLSVFEPSYFGTAKMIQALCTFPLNWTETFFQGTLVPSWGMVLQNQDLGVRVTKCY